MARRAARITLAPYTAGAQGLWLELRRRKNGLPVAQTFWRFNTPITPHKRLLSDMATKLGLELIDVSGKTLDPQTLLSPQERQQG